jgi:hypothetical protein
VLGNGGSQFCGVGKDLSPFTDSSKIVTHVFAGVESLWNLENNNSEFENGLDFVVPATLLKLGKGELDFWVHHFGTSVTGFDFLQVVFGGHSVHETTDEVW